MIEKLPEDKMVNNRMIIKKINELIEYIDLG